MPLTKGEIVQVVGRLTTNVGVKLDDPETPNELTKDEIFELITSFVEDALKEYAD